MIICIIFTNTLIEPFWGIYHKIVVGKMSSTKLMKTPMAKLAPDVGLIDRSGGPIQIEACL